MIAILRGQESQYSTIKYDHLQRKVPTLSDRKSDHRPALLTRRPAKGSSSSFATILIRNRQFENLAQTTYYPPPAPAPAPATPPTPPPIPPLVSAIMLASVGAIPVLAPVKAIELEAPEAPGPSATHSF
ncbi:hypothetical protein F5880DRAFT_1617863 [Lentinula raphanica]|nr:hypothetical protein F5880DRAFT_1617863 [Lentinula raphanica]